MNSQIKQRIEKIKNGKVPDGYKITDIGIIPLDWSQTKLGLIASHVLEKNINSDIKTTFTNSATKGVIKQTDFFDKEISNNENISGYYIVQEHDYIYNPRISVSAPCGPINKSHFCEKGIVSPLYTVFRMNGNLGKSKYIELFFESSLWHRYICGIANYGARHDRMNITNKDFFSMPVPLPSLDEQKKIAEILATQDKIIELKERKIEELKKLKKYYLSKMFPKRGSSYPEVRFPGFTDPWEQHMFCDMFSEKREKTSNENEDVLLSCAISGMYLNSELFGHFRGSTTIGYLKVKKNDLILSAQNLHLGNANVNLRFDHGIISPAYKVFELINCDPNFVQSWVKKEDTKNFFLAASTEGASQCRKNIEWSMLNKKFILVPKINEQKIIGSFFHNIDKLITLHQRELDEEKKFKKSLMQLLLKGIVRV